MYMTTDDLLAWGADYHYPRMVLTTNPLYCLPAGWEAWYSFLSSASADLVLALRIRIQRWEQMRTSFSASTD